jgi:hypothetical protein
MTLPVRLRLPEELELDFRRNFQYGSLDLQALKIELLGVDFEPDMLRLRVRVPDRDTAEPLELRFNIDMPIAFSDKEYAENVQKAVTMVIAHEVLELLKVGGQRNDPHGSETTFGISLRFR